MAETFPTTIKPTISSQRNHQPRIKEISFGNGYVQRYGDGINNNLETLDLTFFVGDTDKATIETLFNTSAGYIPFNYTKTETGASQKQYICEKWSINPMGSNKYNITCVFKEFAGLI